MSENTPSTVKLTAPTRLLVALAALSSTTSTPVYPPPPPSGSTLDSLLDDSDEADRARARAAKAAQDRVEKSLRADGRRWLEALCKILEIDIGQLPGEIDEERVKASVSESKDDWTQDEKDRIGGVLVEAGLAASKALNDASAKAAPAGSGSGGTSGGSMFGFGSSDKKKAEEEAAANQLRYTPVHRTFAHHTLSLLSLAPAGYLPRAEAKLGATLFSALKSASDAQNATVESTRAKHAEGWGGSFGRKLATGAGVIAGGVLLGVTGGLAAPAIAAVLAPLGVGGILSAGAAPVVLGTLFGVGGGGLAGRRVRERWAGVGQFGFVEVGKGTKVSQEEVDELKGAKERYKARVRKPRGSMSATAEAVQGIGGTPVTASAAGTGEGVGTEKDKSTEEEVSDSRRSLEERLLNLSLSTDKTGTPTSGAVGNASPTSTATLVNLDSPRPSIDSGNGKRPTLDAPAEEAEIKDAPHPPSLTATIVVPGLLTVSETEAVSAWRAICSGKNVYSATLEQVAKQEARVGEEKKAGSSSGAAITEKVTEDSSGAAAATGTGTGTDSPPPEPEAPIELSASTTYKLHAPIPLSDGRDVYLLRFEPTLMLKTGRDIDHWVTSKLKGKIKAEIIKRTVLNAYFAAVSLPLTVYGVASMSLDNSWMQAQDRANKAGRILGEVLEQRVQGERPVVLIGSSLGALTILKALLYLSSRTSSSSSGTPQPLSAYVESAYLISLPSAPTSSEWTAARSVVSRRLVNAYSGADWVLAGVVRLHEVISRAATLNSGISPAGLAPVEAKGVENVDVSEVLRGHMEVNAKMADILRVIDVDA